MPGIAGVIGKGDADATATAVAEMMAAMRHEPEYVEDVFPVPACHACVGWVAHPDSFASNASGSTRDGISIAFSGECFGESMERCDPRMLDSIASAYRLQGPSFVSNLNGLFSGVLLDENKRCAYLFLDRFASERVYYHRSGAQLYFASEAKALLAIFPELREFDAEGVAQFLAYGSCHGTQTLFRGINRLNGASLWVFDAGGADSCETYFSPSEWEGLDMLPEEEFETAFVETSRSVFPAYLNAESEVGFSITGGFDTRMILAALSQEERQLACYTYGASSGDTRDVRIGRKIADSLSLRHQTLRLDDQFIQGYQSYLDRSVFISDGCASALNAHELFFSERARTISPIRLTGNYGSEVLRSMSTLKPMSLAEGLIEPCFALQVSAAEAARKHHHQLTGTVFDEISCHLFGPLATARSLLTVRTPYLDNAIVRLAYQAPQSARQSTAAALRLIASGSKQLAEIPTDLGHSCSRESSSGSVRKFLNRVSFKLDYWDKEGLPPRLGVLDTLRPLLERSGVLGQHKFLPYRSWFKFDLADLVEAATRRAASGGQPWWEPGFVRRIPAAHASGRQNYLREISAVLTLDSVQRVLFDEITDRVNITKRSRTE